MVADIPRTIVDFIKLSPRYLVAVALATGLLLFLPLPWLGFLGVDTFSHTYRQWLGLTFLSSACICVVALSLSVWKWLGRKVFDKRVRTNIIRKLHSLTEDEKQILRYYFALGTRANTLRIDDGVVQGLVANRVIFRSSSMGNMLEGFAHNISDIAWDYMHEHPSILEGSTNSYRTDKRSW